MGFLLLHTLSFCELVVCFFAAFYFVVLRVGGVFGFFAAFYFVVLRVGGVFGFFAAFYFVVVSFFFFCCFLLHRSASWWGFGVFGFFASS